MRSKTENPRHNAGNKETPEQEQLIAAPDTPQELASDDPDALNDADEIDLDDPQWEVFLADDDERDPQPDYGDFYFPD